MSQRLYIHFGPLTIVLEHCENSNDDKGRGYDDGRSV